MSEIYGNKINSFTSVVKSFDKTIKSNRDFQKNLINSTNSFYLKMSKKFDNEFKKQNINNKYYFDEAIKTFRDIAKSVRSISDDIKILINKQTKSNQKILSNISGESFFGPKLRARGKQRGFLQTLVRQRQMQKLGVAGVGIASPFQGKKTGIFGSFMKAYKNVYNQWELPYQERMLQSLLDMRTAFVSSNRNLKQVWARLLMESPVFRTIVSSMKTLGKLYSFIYIKPFKWLFRDRKGSKYSARLSRSGTAFDRSATTLGLLYVGSMVRFDRIIYYQGETLKQLELLTGRKTERKKSKYSIFSRYLGGEKMKKYFSGLLSEGISKLPYFGKKRKIKELKYEGSEMMKEQLSIPNLLIQQLSVLKGIYTGITGRSFKDEDYLKSKKDRIVDIQEQLEILMKKKPKIKIDELNKSILLKYEKTIDTLKQIGEKGSIINIKELTQRLKKKYGIKYRRLKKIFDTRKSLGESTLETLSNMYLLSKRRTEYARQQKLGLAKLNFRAKRGFSKLIWGGIMILGFIKKIVGGIFSLPLKLVTTLIKYGPSLGARFLLGKGLGLGSKALVAGKTLLKGTSRATLGAIGGAIFAAYDAYKGVKKSKQWFGPKATTGEKVASGVGGLIGGTSGAFTAKGALYGVAKGVAIGTMFGGPIGAGIGALAGGILGFVGGKNISKALSFIGSKIKLFSKAIWNLIKMPINLIWESMKLIKNSFMKESTGIMKWVKKAGMSILKPMWNVLTFPFKVFQKVLEFIAGPKKMIMGMLASIPLVGRFFKDNKDIKPTSTEVTPLPIQPISRFVSISNDKIPKMATGGVANDNMLAYLHKGEEVKPKKFVDNTVKQLKLLNEKLDPIGRKGKSIFRDFLSNWKTGFKILKNKYEEKKPVVSEKSEKTMSEILKSLKTVSSPKKGEKHLQYVQGGLSGRLSLAEKIAGISYSKKQIKPLTSYLVKKNDTIEEITRLTGTTWDQLRMWNPDSWGQLPLSDPKYPGGYFFKEGTLLKIYKRKMTPQQLENKIMGISKSDIARSNVAQKKAESDGIAKTIANQNKNIINESNKQNVKTNSAIIQSMQNVSNNIKNISNISQNTNNNNNQQSQGISPEYEAALLAATI